jgi:2-keto-3-deoxy-L-rhamnonate aldolase RhmA
MFENAAKRRLAKGLPTVGQWISLPSPSIVELLSSYSMDWVTIDTEHGGIDRERLEDMMRAMRGAPVTPLARVTANDPALIKQALDRGAFGVVVPMVSSADEARAAVAAAKYPPDGLRGVAGTRVSRYGADLVEYLKVWNNEVLVVCQIETLEGLEKVDQIAAVPGVDVLFIGPNDLSASLNVFRQFDHVEYKNAVDRIRKAAERHGKATGYMAASADEVLQRIDEGMRFIATGTDARLLAGAAAALYGKIDEGLAARKVPPRAT